jgi:TolB-like protein/DNA-binding winged helix-turn-helix (wHTH) protein
MCSVSDHVYFSDFDVDLDNGEIRRQGVRVRLRGKPCQILIALLRNAGEVVTRQQLIESLWPANTFVDFESNLKTALSTLRRVLGDSADFPRFVETIQGVGYRFVHPVSRINPAPAVPFTREDVTAPSLLPISTLSGDAVPEFLPAAAANLGESQWRRITAGAAVLMLAGIFIFAALRGRQTAAPNHERAGRVMMVLPFENLSGDASTESLTDGITKRMTTSLQDHLSGKLAVVAQGSALQYKHSHKSLDEISKEMGGIDYILDGTVKRSHDSVDIDVELLRVSDHKSVWTGTFETKLTDMDSSQQEIATHILESLSVEVRPTQSPDLRTDVLPEQHSGNGTSGL